MYTELEQPRGLGKEGGWGSLACDIWCACVDLILTSWRKQNNEGKFGTLYSAFCTMQSVVVVADVFMIQPKWQQIRGWRSQGCSLHRSCDDVLYTHCDGTQVSEGHFIIYIIASVILISCIMRNVIYGIVWRTYNYWWNHSSWCLLMPLGMFCFAQKVLE